MAPTTFHRRVRVFVPAAAAALLLAVAAPTVAHADPPTPGPAGLTPTVVSAAGGQTVYVWGSGLQDPSTTVNFYCPVPNPVQANASPQASVAPLAQDPGGAWLAVTVPAQLALGADTCVVSVANSAHSGNQSILVGAPAGGSGWAPTLHLAPAGQAPAVSAATPAVVPAAFDVDTPPAVSFAAQGTTDLTGAKARQLLCQNNLAGVYPGPPQNFLVNATTPTATAMAIYPQSLPAVGSGPNYCAIEITVGSGAYAGQTILVPGTAPAAAPSPAVGGMYALEYQPPYTGPITVHVVNRTGIPDAQLFVSVMGQGGAVSGFSGVNTNTITTVAFTSLNYDAAAHSASFTISNGITSGDIYLSKATNVGGTFTNVGTNVPPPSPVDSPYRYALAEFSYSGSFYTDLTLIDQVGFSMSSALYTDAAGTALLPGSRRTTGCFVDLVDGIRRIVPSSAWTTSAGGIIRTDANGATIGYVGAAKAPQIYTSASDKAYVDHVQGLGPLTINDLHSAANQPGEFAYTATYAGGTWTLTGTIESGSKAGPTLQVESASIYAAGSHGGTGYALYGQDGPFRVQIDSTDYGWGNGAQAPADHQDLVKTIYRDFIAAFAYGYWGSTYPQPPVGGVTAGTSTGPAAAYFTMNPRTGAYANAGVPAGSAAWNAYDQLVRRVSSGDGGASGAYGTAYSDTFVPAALSPAIGTTSAQAWRITLGDAAGCASPPAPPSPSDEPSTPTGIGSQPTAPVAVSPPAADEPPALFTPPRGATNPPTAAVLAPGVVMVSQAVADKATPTSARLVPTRTVRSAPVARTEAGRVVQLRLAGLPRNAAVQAFVVVDRDRVPVAALRTTRAGRLTLPALRIAKPGRHNLGVVTPNGQVRWVAIRAH